MIQDKESSCGNDGGCCGGHSCSHDEHDNATPEVQDAPNPQTEKLPAVTTLIEENNDQCQCPDCRSGRRKRLPDGRLMMKLESNEDYSVICPNPDSEPFTHKTEFEFLLPELDFVPEIISIAAFPMTFLDVLADRQFLREHCSELHEQIDILEEELTKARKSAHGKKLPRRKNKRKK